MTARSYLLFMIVSSYLVACSPQPVADTSVCPPIKVYTCQKEIAARQQIMNAPDASDLLQDYRDERAALAACRNEPPPRCQAP